jgi:hypothetical protein
MKIDKKLLDIIYEIEKIGTEKDDSFFYTNPVSRISKLHDEKTERLLIEIAKYEFTRTPILMIKVVTRFLGLSAIGICLSLLGMRQNYIFDKLLKNDSLKESRSALIVSHGTGRNVNSEKDLYIPIPLDNELHQKRIWLYIDHVKKISFAPTQLMNRPGLHIIIPRTMGFRDLFSFVFQSFRILKKYFIEAKHTNKESILRVAAINLLIINQFSKSAYSNFNLLRKIKKGLITYEVESISFTVEGHPHEEIIRRLANAGDQSVKLEYYQTAPFCQAQTGIKFFLENIRAAGNTKFYVYGKKSAEFISKIPNKTDIQILGSRNFVEKHKCGGTKSSVLIAPEAMDYENLKFLEFAIKLVESNTGIDLRIRTHPDYEPTNEFNELKKRLLNLGATFSSQPLSRDLCESSFILYSGSSVCLEALAHGVTPIYVKNRFGFDTNPLNNSEGNPFHEIDIFEKVPILDFRTFPKNDLQDFYEMQIQSFKR